MDQHSTLLVLFLVSSWSLIFTNSYTIERRVVYDSNKSKWVYKPDKFIMPSSVCLDSRSAQSSQCNILGGSRVGNCQCKCKSRQGSFFYDHSSDWQCFENENAHSYGGCSDVLDRRTTSKPLIVIPMATPTTSYQLPWPYYLSCDTEYNYLRCDGTWKKMDTNLIYTSGHYLEYLVPSSIPNIGGKVIKMTFDCDNSDWQPDWGEPYGCVLFKIKGTTTCPETMPSTSLLLFATMVSAGPSSTPSSTVTSTVTSTAAIQVVSSSVLSPPQSPSPSPSPSPASVRTMILQSTPSLHEQFSSTPSTVPAQSTEGDTNPPSVKHVTPITSGINTETNMATSPSAVNRDARKGSRSGDDSSGLIAGAVSGVLVLAIAVAVIVVIRKRQKRESNSNDTVAAENPGYARGTDNSLKFSDGGQRSTDDQEEYSYAYNNTVPFVRTSKQDTANNDTIHNQGLESNNSVANRVYGKAEDLNKLGSPPTGQKDPVYNTLEEPEYAKVDKSSRNPATNSDGSIYNTLEEPEYARLDKSKKPFFSQNRSEPLYNVLERPEFEKSTGLNDEPPCYQVLEGPIPEGAPVYDVLEGPDSEGAPVYGSLEGQDHHVYGALDIRDTKENGGYDDMVYDAVGDNIFDQEDIYQQLNNNGQRNSDVYQALNYPDKTMYLKELNQSNSDA